MLGLANLTDHEVCGWFER